MYKFILHNIKWKLSETRKHNLIFPVSIINFKGVGKFYPHFRWVENETNKKLQLHKYKPNYSRQKNQAAYTSWGDTYFVRLPTETSKTNKKKFCFAVTFPFSIYILVHKLRLLIRIHFIASQVESLKTERKRYKLYNFSSLSVLYFTTWLAVSWRIKFTFQEEFRQLLVPVQSLR